MLCVKYTVQVENGLQECKKNDKLIHRKSGIRTFTDVTIVSRGTAALKHVDLIRARAVVHTRIAGAFVDI